MTIHHQRQAQMPILAATDGVAHTFQVETQTKLADRVCKVRGIPRYLLGHINAQTDLGASVFPVSPSRKMSIAPTF